MLLLQSPADPFSIIECNFSFFKAASCSVSRAAATQNSTLRFHSQFRRVAAMDVAKEVAPFLLDRGARVTRGKRMTRLLDDELEEDELFWNQDALKDEENDDNYEEEPEVVDEFDSHFDEDEPEADEEAENNEAEERVRPKKRLIFPGKTLAKRTKKKNKVLSNLEGSLNDEDEKTNEQSIEQQHHDAPEDGEVRRTVR